MKTFSYFTTLILLTTTLVARENPFMPTQAYENEVARLMEIDQYNLSQEFMGGDENIEKEDMTPILKEDEVNKPHPNAVAKSEEEIMLEQKKKEKAMAKERALKEALRKAEMAKKEADRLEKEKQMALKKAEELEKRGPIVYVKKRDDIELNESLEVLPFLDVNYTNDEITLNSKFPVFKKFYLEDEKKLIVDFKGDVTFYTKRVDLESKHFKKLIAGNHKKDKFFRVVLVVEEEPYKYNVKYNDESVFINLK